MSKIKSEKRTVEMMIRLYCRKNHKCPDLCSACSELLDYALVKLDKCVFGDNKMACKVCKIHCYKKDRREEIRNVMRFSGPRMIVYYPVEYFKHIKRKRL